MRYVLMVIGVLFVCSDSYGQNCTGSLATPSCGRGAIRSVLASKPIRTGILARISAKPSGSCGQSLATPSCGQAAPSCSQAVQSVQVAPVPQAACNCGCEQGLPCTCSSQKSVPVLSCPTGTCSLAESRLFSTPIRSALSSGYQQALASAQYRAANRIHGHCSLDTHRTSGVGWATSDPTPNTCLGHGGDSYAVVRGSDGWYATKFQ